MFNPTQFLIDNANKRIAKNRDQIVMLQHARMSKESKKYMVKHYQEKIKAEEQFIKDIQLEVAA